MPRARAHVAKSGGRLHFIGHQANLLVLESVARRAELGAEEHWHNVVEHGNTGAAGAPSVLSQHWDELGARRRGDPRRSRLWAHLGQPAHRHRRNLMIGSRRRIPQRTSFSHAELLAISQGNLVKDPPAEFIRLPAPPMLMVDRVVEITRSGARGRIVGEQDIHFDDWFFHCHFRGDPVQPGCLGVDAVWQLVGLYIAACWCARLGSSAGLQGGRVRGPDPPVQPSRALRGRDSPLTRSSRSRARRSPSAAPRSWSTASSSTR